MKEQYRPHRYQKPISTFWWLRGRAHLLFAVREFSCLFVAGFVIYLLMLVDSVYAGEAQYKHFVAGSGNGWILAINGIAALFLLTHTITWFNQTPQALVVRLRGQRVARRWIIASIYGLWALLSGSAIWIVLAG